MPPRCACAAAPCRFSPSAVKKVCEDVVTSVLAGKAWHGEEETVWTVQIAEQIKFLVKGAARRGTTGRGQCLAARGNGISGQ